MTRNAIVLLALLTSAVYGADALQPLRTVRVQTRKTQYVLLKRDESRIPREGVLRLQEVRKVEMEAGDKISLGAINPEEGEIVKVEKDTGEVMIRDQSSHLLRQVFPAGIVTNTSARVINMKTRENYILRNGDRLLGEWTVISLMTNNSVVVSNETAGIATIPALSESEIANLEEEMESNNRPELAGALGCTCRTTTVQSERTPSPRSQTVQIKSDFSAADFKAAIIGQWESVFTYKNRPNIQTLIVSSDGHASLVVKEMDSKQMQYSGAYTITFDREPSAGAVTFANISIKPEDAPEIILSRVNFGLHNGIHLQEGIVLRIDREPYGVLKKRN